MDEEDRNGDSKYKASKCCEIKTENKCDCEICNTDCKKSNLQNNVGDFKKMVDKSSLPLNGRICYEPSLTCAEKLTDGTILLAKSILTGTRPEIQPEFEKFEEKKKSIWPRVRSLTWVSGLEAVVNYVESLQYDMTLKYCVDFVSQKVDGLSTTFTYQVKWSIPNKSEPVQLSTAHMYFFLKAYWSHPSDYPIEVTYTYENSSSIFRPDEASFRETWLINIIDSKTEFRRKNDFKIETFL